MTKLIRIGNSRGVRIPAPLIEQAGLDTGELTLKVVQGGLLIQVKRSGRKAREGWDAAFERAMSGQAHNLSPEDREWLDADLVDGLGRKSECAE